MDEVGEDSRDEIGWDGMLQKRKGGGKRIACRSGISCLWTHPLAATLSAPTITQSIPFTAIKADAIESAISVPGKPSCTISKAVRRAP